MWREPLNFTASPGETILISGPSGCGKSTLLRALACLDPLQGGRLELGGQERSSFSAAQWRKDVRYFVQKLPTQPGFTQTPQDLAERIQSFESHSGPPIAPAARTLIVEWGLEEDKFDQAWDSLSGGEAHRCGLAIALASNPAVLLLDEPTAALDEGSTLLVERSIQAREGATVIVSHSEEQAERIATRRFLLAAQ